MNNKRDIFAFVLIIIGVVLIFICAIENIRAKQLQTEELKRLEQKIDAIESYIGMSENLDYDTDFEEYSKEFEHLTQNSINQIGNDAEKILDQ